jgi:hypothetical protein
MEEAPIMFAYKVPLFVSIAVVSAYVMPPSTNQALLVAQALFAVCVSFALFMLVLHAAERRHDRGGGRRAPRGVTARRELRRAMRDPHVGGLH